MGQQGKRAKRAKRPRAARARTETTPAPSRGAWIAVLALLLVGLALSSELVRLHFAAAFDPAFRSYCAVNETVSCDAVTRSAYAAVFGVPLATWGVFGYAAMALTAGLGLTWRSRAPAALLAILGGFALVVTVLLAAISHFLIHAWCLLCIGTYAVNVTVAILSLSLLRKLGARASFRALLDLWQKRRWHTVAGAGGAGAVALAILLFHPRVHASSAVLAPAAASASASAPADDSPSPIPPGARIERGVTADGLPWIGAAKPTVTITEFSDYECHHCQLAFRGMHELLSLNPDRLRLVVRHFPLDQSCNPSISRPMHQRSCLYAKLATCSGKQQRFWEAHEYLFEHAEESVDPATLAAALQLDAGQLDTCLQQIDPDIRRDVEAGIALDLHGTPAFVVDGRVYLQGIPQSVASQLRLPEQ